MTELTDEQLAEIEARTGAAGQGDQEADLALALHCIEDLTRLAAEVRRLRDIIDTLREALGES